MSRSPEIRHKHNARSKVDYAIKTGRMFRPSACQRCEAEPQPLNDGRAAIQAHHHAGYDHPLDVEWLCVKCHSLENPKPQLAKTHCPAGHEYTSENTYLGPKRGERRCRECASARDQLRGPGWYRRVKNVAQ